MGNKVDDGSYVGCSPSPFKGFMNWKRSQLMIILPKPDTGPLHSEEGTLSWHGESLALAAALRSPFSWLAAWVLAMVLAKPMLSFLKDSSCVSLCLPVLLSCNPWNLPFICSFSTFKILPICFHETWFLSFQLLLSLIHMFEARMPLSFCYCRFF